MLKLIRKDMNSFIEKYRATEKVIASTTKTLIFFTSFAFLLYILSSFKVNYLIYGLIIFLISSGIRKTVFKNITYNLTEGRYYMLSLVLLMYVLFYFQQDTHIYTYLPENVFILASAMILLNVIIVILFGEVGYKPSNVSLLTIAIYVILILLYVATAEHISAFIQNNLWIRDLVMGVPSVYIILTLIGINERKLS